MIVKITMIDGTVLKGKIGGWMFPDRKDYFLVIFSNGFGAWILVDNVDIIAIQKERRRRMDAAGVVIPIVEDDQGEGWKDPIDLPEAQEIAEKEFQKKLRKSQYLEQQKQHKQR